ncbi:MAG: DUF6174 domain-containing protein [Pseudomonadota bacterium]
MKASVKPKPAFQIATLLAGVVLLLIVFVSAGYFFTLGEIGATKPPIVAELERQEALWRASEPTYYGYTVDRECYCAADYREPYTVTIDGGLRSFGYSRGLQAANPGAPQTPPEPVTIDDLFQLLHNAATQADTLSVSYDSEFGYPETIRIDWQEALADEEQYFTIRDFRRLP